MLRAGAASDSRPEPAAAADGRRSGGRAEQFRAPPDRWRPPALPPAEHQAAGPTTAVQSEAGHELQPGRSHGSSPVSSKRATRASHSRSGSTRPTPVTAHTGVPRWAPTAAAASDPGDASTPAGPPTKASTRTSSATAAAEPTRPSGISTASPPASTSRRARPAPSPPASTTRASTSPRRRRASPVRSGQPRMATVAPSGRASTRCRMVRSPFEQGGRLPGGSPLVVGTEDPRRQPPHRARGQMAFDQPATGRYQPGRFEGRHLGQGVGRLAGHQGRVGAGTLGPRSGGARSGCISSPA